MHDNARVKRGQHRDVRPSVTIDVVCVYRGGDRDARTSGRRQRRAMQGSEVRGYASLAVAGKVGGEWRFRFVCTDLHQRCAHCLGEVLGGVTQALSGGRAC